MQKLIYLSCLLIISIVDAQASKAPALEGIFYNPEYGIQIFVESSFNHIKVKGLNNNRRWQKFSRIDRNFWQDRQGNKITKGRRSQLIYHFANRRYGRRNQILHFYKSKRRGNLGRNSKYYDERTSNRKSNSYENNGTGLYGNWYSNDFRLTMYIEPTSDGLRSRLENENAWTYYNKKSEYWEDAKGNKLLKERDGTLYWQSKNGRRKISLSRQDR